MSFIDEFYTKLDEFTSSPFLFIGSGFSFRYLGSDDWQTLLRKYASKGDIPFERYRSKANGDWTKVGSMIAADYHTFWFESPDTKDERENYVQEMGTVSSPLKVSISKSLEELSRDNFKDGTQEEIELLSHAKIDGIITTNDDLLCERIFSSFKIYKSQQELIFSSLQEVGEIYKIHGCCTEPNSIVITEEDYEQFNERNSYLAAKLLTIFLEHPTIFIGYSITDTNVRSILSAVTKCLDQDQVNQLSERLFFIQYNADHDGEPIIDKYQFEIGGILLPLTRICTKSFVDIFKVLGSLHQKFPAALLRKIKQHIYELVQTNDPTEKINVIDFDTDTDLDKVDVVIGVGVGATIKNEKAHDSYTRFDIAEDVLKDNMNFDSNGLLDKTLPQLIKSTQWIPVCKYLQKIDLASVNHKLIAAFQRPIEEFRASNPYAYKRKPIQENFKSIQDVSLSNDAERSVKILLLLDPSILNLDELRNFLIDNFHLTRKNGDSSYFMKLVCLYDKLFYTQ